MIRAFLGGLVLGILISACIFRYVLSTEGRGRHRA